MNKDYVNTARVSVAVRTFLIILAAVVCFAFLTGMNRPAKTAKDDEHTSYMTYVVQEGDTIWSIAENNLSDRFPTCRSYVKEVMRANNMKDSDIYPGDLIAVPAAAQDGNDTLTASAGR